MARAQAQRNGGFSTAPRNCLSLPLIEDGPFGYPRVNVAAQQSEPGSLLCRIRHMIHTLRARPELSSGSCVVSAADT